ncbi:hypothetical protein NQ317_012618 [Molorchus minor]|uniref:SKICH domain-containing protein n=1 Tax=Molorchus minor TaxID=1323400 RepID=A0ABQ9JLA2_9CUCU|nr:hypothetical protein NQ317_012618 [Molorchus minor]
MATDSIESNFVSMKPAVEFIDIVDQYSYNEDLECTFKFNDYTPQEGDRVAIFKLGWTLVKDYVVFEWAPIDTMVKVHSVIFNKHILPKNNTEIYQVCYISGENVLHGASSSFQFSASLSPVMNKSIMCLSLSEDMVDSTRKPNDSDEELRKVEGRK